MSAHKNLNGILIAAVAACFAQTALADGIPAAAPDTQAVTAEEIQTGKANAAQMKRGYDAEAFDPSISFKDVPDKEIDLPGVLHIKGESVQALDPARSHRLSWGNQGIQTIPLSLSGYSLIVIPFQNPRIIGNSFVKIDKRAKPPYSNNLYVAFDFPDGVKPSPITVFIEDPAGGPALGLQLVPKKIPQQVYTVVDETDRLSLERKKDLALPAHDYITRIQNLMELVGQGGTPSGYAVSTFDLPPVMWRGLQLNAQRRYSNTEGDIYTYLVSNPGNKTIPLDEREFDGVRVKAVSFYPPAPELRPNGQITVIVLAAKPEKE